MFDLISRAGPCASPQPTVFDPYVHNAVVLIRRLYNSAKAPNDAKISGIDSHEIVVVAAFHPRVEDHDKYMFEK